MSMFKHRRHGCGTTSTGAGFGILGLLAGAGLVYWLFGTDSGNEKRGELMSLLQSFKKKVAAKKDEALEVVEGDATDAIALASRVKDHLKAIKQDIEETLG